MRGDADLIRLDKWLWQARFFKSRSLSSKVILSGHVRVNGVKAVKPATALRVGDRLAFTQAKTARLVTVLALGHRRGPAPEARALYHDLTPPVAEAPNPKYDGKGRPTKKQRRQQPAWEGRRGNAIRRGAADSSPDNSR